ncbi:hypothetical protein GQ457_17G008110 [Hibiscus cannabinus]
MTYTDLFPILVREGMIAPVQSKPKQPPYPEGYDVKSTCNYHLGGTRHTTEGCGALKNKIMHLIEEGTLSFEGRNPKVSKSPSKKEAPKHAESSPYPTFVIQCQDQNSNDKFPESSPIGGQKSRTNGPFDPIPISYEELYPELLEAHLVAPSYPTPRQPPYPEWYDSRAQCEYHAGIRRHSIEDCVAFKRRVQKLIQCNILRFKNGNELGTTIAYPTRIEPNEFEVEKVENQNSKYDNHVNMLRKERDDLKKRIEESSRQLPRALFNFQKR